MKIVWTPRILGAASLALALCADGLPARARNEAVAKPSLDTLAVYEGSWTGKLTYYATPESKAHVETLALRNDCWRSADYYACHQFAGGVSAALIVYTYDTAQDVFHSHVVPKNGAAAGGGDLLIAGNRWTFPWQDRENGKTIRYRVVNVFADRDTIAFRQEFSTDGRRWTLMADGMEKRMVPGATPKNRPT